MATGSDQLVGFAMVAVASIVFAYYTLWVIVMPFVDEDHPLQSFFLPRIYAVLGPAVAGLTVLLALGAFIGLVVIRGRQQAAKKTN